MESQVEEQVVARKLPTITSYRAVVNKIKHISDTSVLLIASCDRTNAELEAWTHPTFVKDILEKDVVHLSLRYVIPGVTQYFDKKSQQWITHTGSDAAHQVKTIERIQRTATMADALTSGASVLASVFSDFVASFGPVADARRIGSGDGNRDDDEETENIDYEEVNEDGTVATKTVRRKPTRKAAK